MPGRGPLNITGGGAVITPGGSGGGAATPGCTFGGKPMYNPGGNVFTLGLGVAPSTGQITMLASDLAALQAQNTGYELKLRDGTRSLTIKPLYFDESSIEEQMDADAAMVTVAIEDKRSLWQYGELNGTFNKRREDGTSYVTASTNGGTPWTFDELLQKCLDALPGANCQATTGLALIEEVVWRATPPAEALRALLQTVAWDVALDPDGTVRLVDLSTTGSFKPPGGLTPIAGSTEPRDAAHRRPQTLKLRCPIVREEDSTAWEAVLQHDQPQGSTTRGEWDTVANVVATWGITEGYARAVFYKAGDEERLYRGLGGGSTDRGKQRLAYLRGALYRFWRFTDSNGDQKLPLIPVAARASAQTGYEGAVPLVVLAADYHLQRREGWGAFFHNQQASGTVQQPVPWPVRVVDAKLAVIEIRSPRPLAHVEKIPGKSGQTAMDWYLTAPTVPTVRIAYYKKFSSDQNDDYHVRTKDLGGSTNGQVAVKFDDGLVLRQVASGSGYTDQNATALNTVLDARLEAWAERFAVPIPEQHRFAGVASGLKLSAQVRAITWRWENGIETAVRINSDRTPDRYGLGLDGRARQARWVAAVAAGRQWVADGLVGGGGGAHAVGMLGQTPPEHRDFATREITQTYHEAEPSLVNLGYVGILVAEDHRPGPSKAKCCEKAKTTQTTGQTTGVSSNKTINIPVQSSGGTGSGGAVG